jgi:homoserine kinase
MPLLLGQTVTVRSPATSANLGPGFDCLGLALDLWDEYTATIVDEPGVRVAATGEGAGELPTDERHLVARSLLHGLAYVGLTPTGLELQCVNRVPHRRGLGSSSCAIVGGLVLAAALAPGEGLDQSAVVGLAAELEGHPDNVAAAALGGLTIAWTDAEGAGRAVRSAVHPGVRVTVCIPTHESETESARGMLPASVPYPDAVFNLTRSALLVHALREDPSLLLEATGDRLHQAQRHESYPGSLALVERLRAGGVPAAISGAGPSVLVFAAAADISVPPEDFAVLPVAVVGTGAEVLARFV